MGFGTCLRQNIAGLVFGLRRHFFAQILCRHFHFGDFYFGGTAHFVYKILGLIFHLLQLGLGFAAQSGNFRQRVVTQLGSFAFSIAAQFVSISFCFCPGLGSRDLSIHFGFSGSCLAFRGDLFAFHGSFLLQQGSLLLAVLFHFVGSFLRDDQSVLHGGFHLLIVFQFGADAFYSIFKLYVVLIQAFKILGDFGKKLIDLFGVISAEAFGKVLIV